jgi:GNAT superfamily N-acetyltransferase
MFTLHPSPAAFLAAAEVFLARAPVVNQLPLAVVRQCLATPERYPAGVRCATYHDAAGTLAGAAVQTLPWPVLLAGGSPEAAYALGRDFAALDPALPGVNGPDAIATAFAAGYAEVSGARVLTDSALGLFELTEVAPLPRPSGAFAPATAEHAALLQSWLTAFWGEATPQDPAPSPDAGLRAATNGRAFLWCLPDATPVAFAYNGRDLEGWASVGPVYTPPHLRGRGYATALVADLSAHLLRDHRGCTLFTNLSNATSNAIYERIGYRRIGTALRLAFTPASTPAP